MVLRDYAETEGHRLRSKPADAFDQHRRLLGVGIRWAVNIEDIIGEAIGQRRVLAIEIINAPGPHMKARRRLAQTVLHGDLTVSS